VDGNAFRAMDDNIIDARSAPKNLREGFDLEQLFAILSRMIIV
jgi:hypothetical protein